MTTSTHERIKEYGRAIERFGHWFDDQRKPDGSLDLPGRSCPAYIPVPVYAQAVGDTELLAWSLRFIADRCHRDAETFLHPPSKTLLPYRAA